MEFIGRENPPNYFSFSKNISGFSLRISLRISTNASFLAEMIFGKFHFLPEDEKEEEKNFFFDSKTKLFFSSAEKEAR